MVIYHYFSNAVTIGGKGFAVNGRQIYIVGLWPGIHTGKITMIPGSCILQL